MLPFGKAKVSSITADELSKRVASGEQPTIIDVREAWEYAEGHIKGALLRPLGEVRQWATEFSPDQELILICRTGARSAIAYKNLEKMGFRNLKNVAGGMVAWRGEVEQGA